MFKRLETLFPNELNEQVAAMPVLVLPLGTIEWHSHHLPVGLDGIVAQKLGEQMADGIGAVLAPVCYWATGGVPFPFTLNLPAAEFETLLRTLLKQHAGMGFSVLVSVTGHFGLDQTLATKRAALLEMQQTSATILPFTTYDLVADFFAGDHAGIGESSLMLALRPDLVRFNAWPADKPLPGVIGEDPRGKATAEFGRRIFDVSAERAAVLVAGFRSGKLDRAEWIEALRLQVEILEITQVLRRSLPREKVPPIATAEYLSGCTKSALGNLAEAQVQFREKLSVLKTLRGN